MVTMTTKRALYGKTLAFQYSSGGGGDPNILRAIRQWFCGGESRSLPRAVSSGSRLPKNLLRACREADFWLARTILVLLALWCSGALVLSVYAQDRGRVLSTAEQQYVNMVKNGSFEAFSAGSSSAPDGFTATGVNTGTGAVAKDASGKFQTYAVKLTQTNAADSYILRYDTAFTGFGASLTGDSADLTATEWQRLTLASNNGYIASVWVKLPGGASNPASITLRSDADQKIYVEIIANAINDYSYIDGLQVTEGPEILAFINNPILDTGDQQIFGDLRIQDNDSTNYIVLDKDTGNITISGTLSATATNADTLDALDSTQFLRSDTADTMSGTLTFGGTATDITTGPGEHLSIMPNGAGNVGIGTTGANQKLQVNGYIALQNGEYIANNNDGKLTFHNEGGSFAQGYFSSMGIGGTYQASLPSNGLYIQGNVGIGTTSPGQMLEVNGYIKMSSAFSAIYMGNSLVLNSQGGGDPKLILDTANTGDALAFNTNSEAMRITSTGNVGIGTTSPNYKLDVYGNGEFRTAQPYVNFYDTSWAGSGYVQFGVDYNFSGAGNYAGLYVPSGKGFSFRSGTNERLIVDTAGNVGIGTAAPGAKLSVSGTLKSSKLNTSLDKYVSGGNYLFNNALSGTTIEDTPPLNDFIGNQLMFADMKGYTVTSSGSITSPLNGLRQGDTAATITNTTLPIVVEITGTIGADTAVANQRVFLQAHLAITGHLLVEVKKADDTWVTLADEDIDIASREYWFSQPVTNVAPYPASWSIKGVRYTITALSQATSYIRQFGWYKQNGFRYPFLPEYAPIIYGTTTLNGNLALGSNTLTTSNTGLVSNLNADYLDGQHGSYYLAAGNISGNSGYLSKFTGTNSLGNSVLYEASGNVGVGTTATSQKLEVAGNIFAKGTRPEVKLNYTGTTGNARLAAYSGSNAYLTSNAYYDGSSWQRDDISTTAGVLSILGNSLTWRSAGSGANPLSLAQPFTIDISGNVGIGTTAPIEKLEITSGNLKVGGTITATGAISGSNVSGTNTGDQTIALTGDVVGSGTGTFAATIQADSVALTTDTTGNYVASLTEGSDIDITNPSGEGISPTINIESQLDNVSTISRASSNLTLQTTASGNIILSPAGNIGIGTTAPEELLVVRKDQNATTKFQVINVTSGASGQAGFQVSTDVNGSYGISVAAASSGFNLGAGYEELLPSQGSLGTASLMSNGLYLYTSHASAPIRFGTGGYGSGAEKMRITSAGNVGIGTASPVAKLDIAGNTNITGTLTTSSTINGQTIGASSSLNALTVGGGYGSTGITMDASGNLQVDGNIYLKGQVWKENTQELLVKNNTITLNDGGSAQDAYIKVYNTNGQIKWANASSAWQITNDNTNFYNISHANTSFIGDVTGTIGATVVGNDSHAHTSTTLPATTTYLGQTIESSEITNDTIVDADINSSAAIVDTKLATISTAGKVSDSALSSAVTKLGQTIESSEITDATIVASDLASGSIIKSKLNDLRPHQIATPNDTVYVESGIVSVANNAKVSFTGSASPVFPVVTANSRIDLLTIDAAGALGRVAGTQAVSPTAPVYPSDKLVLAEVTINETTTVSITDSDITDVRPFLNLGGGSGTSAIVSTESDTFEIDSDDSSATPTLTFGANAGAAPQILTQVGGLTINPIGANNIVMVPDGGNVGIGTTGPGEKLHLSGGDFRSEGAFRTGVSGEPGRWRFYDSNGYLMSFWTTGTDYDTWGLYWDTSDNEMRWMGNGNLKASIDLDDGSGYFQGNVGIGTTGPGQKLYVTGGKIGLDGGQQIIFSDADTTNNLKLQLWSGYGLGINGSTLFYAANGNHSWRDSGGTNERMLLTTAADGGLTVKGTGNSSFAGSVGIGTTDPGAYKLQVQGNALVTGTLTANGTVTLGDNGDNVIINSNVWDITGAGVGSGFTQFTVDNIQIDGANIGYAGDTDLLALANGAMTVNGDLTATGKWTGIKNKINTVSTNLGSPSVEEMALFHGQFNNKFRFIPAYLQEESTDGTTWTSSARLTDNNLKDLMIGEGQSTSVSAIPAPIVGGSGYYRLTWDNTIAGTGYVFLNSLYVYCSTNGNQVNFKIEAYHNTNGWVDIASGATSNWPGHVYIPHTSIPFSTNSAQYGKVRVTFSIASAGYANVFNLYAIEWFGGYPAGRRNAESYDRDRNVTFPATITGTRLLSTVASGTAPLTVTSNTLVTNLNADLLDGHDTSYFQTAITNPVTGTGGTNYIPKFTGASAIGNSSIFDNGNVGIGTTGPLGKLDIAGGADSNGANDQYDIALQYRSGGYRHRITSRHNSGAATGNGIDFYLWNYGVDAAGAIGTKHVMTLDGSGNVGIGTTSPNNTLTIKPADNKGLTIRESDDGNNAIVLEAGASSGIYKGYSGGTQTIQIHSYATAASYFNAGNVGIGTTNPLSQLHILGANSNRYLQLMGTGAGQAMIDVKSDFGTNPVFRINGIGTADLLVVQDNGDTVFNIKDGGNVGIGTTSPSAKLSVSGSSFNATIGGDLIVSGSNTIGAGLTVESTDTGGRRYSLFTTGSTSSAGVGKLSIYDNIATTHRLIVDSAGNIGIGTTVPLAKLDIAGNTNITGTLTTTSTINGQTIATNSALNALTVGGGYGSTGITMDSSGNLQVDGNIYLKGQVWKENTQELYVKNNSIILNDGGSAQDAYIKVYSANSQLKWNNAGTAWQLSNNGTDFYNISHANTSFGGDVTGTIGATVVGNDSHAHTSTTLPATTTYLDQTIGTSELEDSSITSVKIADATIASGDLGAGSVIKSKLNDLRPHQIATPNDTVYVESGIVSVANNAKVSFAGSASPVFPAVTANSRIDLLTIDAAGALGRVAGTQAVTPTAPTYPNDKLVLAEVTINETTTVSITDADITDVRPFLNLGGGSGTSAIVSTESDTFEIDSDDSSATPTLTFGANAGAAPQILTQVGGLTINPIGANNIVMVPDGGNVGIGTTGPGEKLDVIGTIQASNALYFSSSSVQLGEDGTSNRLALRGTGGISFFPNYSTIWDEKMRITTAGNVGIGTTGPSAKLDIQNADSGASPASNTILSVENNNDTKIAILSPYANSGYLTFGNQTTSNERAYIKYNHSSDLMTLQSGGNISMTGNVGIGTTTPGTKLTVASGDVSIDNTRKMNLEGPAGDTFMYRTADNRVVLAVDGIEVADWVKK